MVCVFLEFDLVSAATMVEASSSPVEASYNGDILCLALSLSLCCPSFFPSFFLPGLPLIRSTVTRLPIHHPCPTFMTPSVSTIWVRNAFSCQHPARCSHQGVFCAVFWRSSDPRRFRREGSPGRPVPASHGVALDTVPTWTCLLPFDNTRQGQFGWPKSS